jgi:hypothetical protein
MADQSACVYQACLDVFTFQPWISFQKIVRRIAGCEHSEDVFHSEPTATNDGLAAEDLRIASDAFE